ncbi:MAG: hypothetical protein U0791_18700 [Gemmataceae bacterium]
MMSSPIAESLQSAAAFADELDRHRVLTREKLGEAMVDFPGGGSLGLAEFLIARGDITTFQAERTLAGHGKSLFVGPYRLIEPHHVGAFGPIFRAVKGDSSFALRVLPLRSLWQAKQAKQLVRTLASLSSIPAVVPLVDADSANGCHYLAWPLVSGELLADRIPTRGPFDSVRAIDLLSRLAAALASCHAHQIPHGLLTPQSVCIERDGTPKLLEVGAGLLLARNLAADDSLFDTMSASLAVSTVFDFAAPEWVANPAVPTPGADQYSLGALGCFILSGHADASSLSTRTPSELVAVLNRMLQRDPAARYSGMEEVWAALAELSGTAAEVLIQHDPSEHASRHSGSRIQPSGSPEIDWDAEPLLRPVERDNTEASVHFDLPDAPEEMSDPLGLQPYAAARETPPPAQWQTAAYEVRQTPTPPPRTKMPLFDAAEGHHHANEKLPELPAAPLPPLTHDSPNSGKWDAAAAKPASGRPSEGKSGSAIWKRVKRKVLFWQTPGDTVQISVFGQRQITHSESPRLTVFLHSPSAAASVATLARAFHHEAELLGSGTLSQVVNRGEPLDVHLAVAHTSVTNPLGGFTWQGQPHRLTFDFVVPWEAPIGPARAVLSVGRSDVRIGKLEFTLTIRDGTG